VPILPGRASDERLRAILGRAEDAPYSYPEVGATRGEFPGGYHSDHYAIDLDVGGGPASGAFARGVEGLRRWQVQRGAGARVVPADAEVVAGQTILVALSFPLMTLVAPCRVVYLTDEPNRFGYAYGTLAGHPERGEESFHVVRTEAGTRFEISAFSRPAHPLARAGAPAGRYLQRRVTNRYLRALRDFVCDPEDA
jgi:uncharacterized protein (UPF0548 family)